MTNVGQYNAGRRMLADPSVRPIFGSDKSATRTDIALLVSMLFLQRFSLPFSDTALQLELVAMGLILFYQFISGKLLIQYDRLLWDLAGTAGEVDKQLLAGDLGLAHRRLLGPPSPGTDRRTRNRRTRRARRPGTPPTSAPG
jgi:hypothetical protein